MTKKVTTGLVEMAIYNENGQVVQRFKKAMNEVRFDSENAIMVARAITDNAFVARDGVKPVGDTLKAELVERHRTTLTQRFALMLGTLRKDVKKTDGQVAIQLVEAALKEIF